MRTRQTSERLDSPLLSTGRNLAFANIDMGIRSPTGRTNVLGEQPTEHVKPGAVAPPGMKVGLETVEALLKNYVTS